MRQKKKPALIFTPNQTIITTWIGSPVVDNEVKRIEISRDSAARWLREARKKKEFSR